MWSAFAKKMPVLFTLSLKVFKGTQVIGGGKTVDENEKVLI